MHTTNPLTTLCEKEIENAKAEIRNNSLWELGAKSKDEAEMFRKNIEQLIAYISILRELSEKGTIASETDEIIDQWLKSMLETEIMTVRSQYQQISNEHDLLSRYLQTLDTIRHNISVAKKGTAKGRADILVHGSDYYLIPSLELYTVHDYMGKKLPGLAILLKEAESGADYGVLTVSFGEFISIKNAAYIDTNNIPKDVISAICDKNASRTPLKKTGKYGTEYPLYVFNEEWLRSIGEKNYNTYSTAFDKYML